MARMTNDDVIYTFVNTAKEGKSHTGHLFVNGEKLVNYSTVIAVKLGNKIYLNSTKYSKTTSIIQNKIRREINATMLVEVTESEMKARGLI